MPARHDPLKSPVMIGEKVSYRVRLVQIAAYKQFEAVTRGFGSAPRYLGVLCLLDANPGLSQSRLAEEIYLDRSSLVAIIDTLAREGLVERRPTPEDKRVRRLFLTKQGGATIRRLRPLVEAHEAALVAGLSAQERTTLAHLLGRVAENLRRASEAEHKRDAAE